MHAKNFSTTINRYDPRLYNKVMDEIDKKITVCFNSFSGVQFNPEREVLQEALFNGMNLGLVDNLIDLIKFGRFVIQGGKYKLSEYLLKYKSALEFNLTALGARPKNVDLRKGEVSYEEINNALKNIYLKS